MGGVWLPGLIVLGVGIVAGLAAAWKLRRGSSESRERDLNLRIGDLQARREQIYARLRGDQITSDERRTLELAAARVLRELDRLGALAVAESGADAKSPEAEGVPAAEAETPAAAVPTGRWTGIIGFTSGLAVAGLIGLLIYWAGRDAAPGERAAPQPRGASAQTAGPLPPDHPPIPSGPSAEESEQIAELERRLEEDPSNLLARKELSLAQLSAGQYMEAFESATEILEAIPEDPDGLFVQGVVRLTMGQNTEAVDLFDRVLARFPNHLQAMAYRGLGLYQSGATERAVDTWEMGLEMAGGQSPQFEALLQMAREQAMESPPSVATTPAPPPAAPPSAAAPTTATAGVAYPSRIEVAPGAVVDPRAILFVALRPAAGGPPIAVRRIRSPRFPLTIELSQQDSMMGAELPTTGLLTARLDSDGSATTRSPGDLSAETEASAGQPVSLVLSPE